MDALECLLLWFLKPLSLTRHWLFDCLTAWQLDSFVPTEQLMSKCLLTGGIKGEVITKVTASHGACDFSSVLLKQAPVGGDLTRGWVLRGSAVSPHRNTVASRWCLFIYLLLSCTVNNSKKTLLRFAWGYGMACVYVHILNYIEAAFSTSTFSLFFLLCMTHTSSITQEVVNNFSWYFAEENIIYLPIEDKHLCY